MLRALIGLLAVFGAASLAQAQQSGPAPITQYETPAEARWAIFSSDLPACDNPSVLSIITGRFSEAENTYWGGQSAIGAFDRVKEIGFRSNGLAYIPRRYCVARAMMDDPRAAPPIERKPTTVIYDVTADAGIIGFTWGVEWCVVGFDREHAYEPACDVLRPILERWIGQTKASGYGLKARY